MAADVFEITVKLTVNRDPMRGTGNTSQSWLDHAFADFLRQTHYNPSITEVKASCIRRGKELANANTCKDLDDIMAIQSQEWLENMRSCNFPTYFINDNGNVITLKATRGMSGSPVWQDETYQYIIDEHLLTAERFSMEAWELVGTFPMFRTQEEAEA